MYDKRFMKEAIRIAQKSVESGKGGPFGAVVVKDGEIIAASHNSVTSDYDPTAHAEINAIRHACLKLGIHQLRGCEIYSSCEPCPMCMGAIYWARPQILYYASSKKEAAEAGFDDAFIYKEIALQPEQRVIPFLRKYEEGAGNEFQVWKGCGEKKEY